MLAYLNYDQQGIKMRICHELWLNKSMKDLINDSKAIKVIMAKLS